MSVRIVPSQLNGCVACRPLGSFNSPVRTGNHTCSSWQLSHPLRNPVERLHNSPSWHKGFLLDTNLLARTQAKLSLKAYPETRNDRKEGSTFAIARARAMARCEHVYDGKSKQYCTPSTTDVQLKRGFIAYTAVSACTHVLCEDVSKYRNLEIVCLPQMAVKFEKSST